MTGELEGDHSGTVRSNYTVFSSHSELGALRFSNQLFDTKRFARKLTGKLIGRGLTDGTAQPQKIK